MWNKNRSNIDSYDDDDDDDDDDDNTFYTRK